MSVEEAALQPSKSGSVYTAMAHTATRTLALYFSRPVRLFRPSKLNGWQQLRAQALESGHVLSPQYMLWVLKNQFSVLPRHFLPPILVNAGLGTVLWATYSEVSTVLESSSIGDHSTIIASMSGGAAGAMQAVAAAPVENVRLIVEGGSARSGWANAWKEVFLRSRGPESPVPDMKKLGGKSKGEEIKKARAVRDWVRDVRGMAGHGWEGLGWGVMKDACGFAVFFAVFDLTRSFALRTKAVSETVVDFVPLNDDKAQSVKRHAPRTIHGVTLVTGGVVAGLGYEMVTRPWDAARRAVRLEEVTPGVTTGHGRFVIIRAVARLYREEGLIGFFRDPLAPSSAEVTAPIDRLRQRLWTGIRVLGRVGPWGVGFLVWEMIS